MRRCSPTVRDQSRAPDAAVGTAAKQPNAINPRAARASAPVTSSIDADNHEPTGMATSAGCNGWVSGSPPRISSRRPEPNVERTMRCTNSAGASNAVICPMRAETPANASGNAAIT
jgi:hypothetical protein